MAKKAIFITTEQQRDNALAVLAERGEDIPIYITHPLRVPDEAMEIVRREGIQVIIARGGVSLAFKQCTELPVIDLVLTAQELGMLIVEAKAILKDPHPTIALVTYANMLGDMSDVEALFSTKLNIYYVDSLDEMAPAALKAREAGADLIIGGVYVRAVCQERGIPYLDNPPGKVSIRNALQIASQVSYSIDLQQRINSESRALLNFSFNGIIKLDPQGRVVTMNHRAESLLDMGESEALGRHISDFIPAVDAHRLTEDVFNGGEELFCTFRRGEDAFALSIAPIIDGAIVSCYDIEGLSNFEREARSDLNSGEDRTKYTYKWLSSMAEEHSIFIKTLSDQAQFDESLLISSPNSLERRACADFIRSGGLRADMPYGEFSAAAYSGREQAELMFGSLYSLNGGTVFIDEVEALSLQCQQRLCSLIRDGRLITSNGTRPVDIRVIAGTSADLKELCLEGRFRFDLYYALWGHRLFVPGLTGCPNAIAKWASFYLDKYCSAYGRFTSFTKQAKKLLGTTAWPGGHAQLQAFCRKAASESYRRALDDVAVGHMLSDDGPADTPQSPENADAERAQLQKLMDKYGGNRARIADELHISKTTLWRRMKEYNLL